MSNIVRIAGVPSGYNVRGLYTIELPRSLYYGEAADWFVTDTQNFLTVDSWQIICNGELWVIKGDAAGAKTILCRSLSTGEVTYTEALALQGNMMRGNGSYGPYCRAPFTTDGESRIWWICANVEAQNYNTAMHYYLNEYNVITKTHKSYQMHSFAAGGTYSNMHYSAFNNLGQLYYSKNLNKIFWFGGSNTKYTTNSSYPWNGDVPFATFVFDLAAETFSTLSGLGSGLNNAYVYEKDEYIYIGAGFRYSGASPSKNANIYRFNPHDNVMTTIRTDFTQHIENMTMNANGTLIFMVGEHVMQITPTDVYIFDPITGLQVEGMMPTPYGTDIAISGNIHAMYNNRLYMWTKTDTRAFKEITLYTEAPADAPIVAKIYCGQKFHSLVPFKLLRQGIDVTTVQQEATEDIEIKMYDYSSEGGQVLYIET